MGTRVLSPPVFEEPTESRGGEEGGELSQRRGEDGLARRRELKHDYDLYFSQNGYNNSSSAFMFQIILIIF